MATLEPREKKGRKLEPSQQLPLIRTASDELHLIKGTFNGLSVVVENEADMKNLISMGCFGKANLSRNYPEFQKSSPEIIPKRVFNNRKSITKDRKSGMKKVIVLPDCDLKSEDVEEYFTNLKPEYQIDYSGIAETVNLGLEEAFFLAAALNCLEVSYQKQKLKIEEIWTLFKQSDDNFCINYLAYYYFRSKNWVVKPGIKFGGDFLLYKQGPSSYHASYVVIIRVLDESLNIMKHIRRRGINYTYLMGLHRLCETAGKELLICDVIWPTTFKTEEFDYNDISKFSIKETIMERQIF